MQNNTTDQSLQERLAKYLNKEELKFQAFKENKDKAYIYILKVKEEDIPYSSILPTEYFFDLNLACECGREANLPFMIEKYLVEAPKISGQYDPEGTCSGCPFYIASYTGPTRTSAGGITRNC